MGQESTSLPVWMSVSQGEMTQTDQYLRRFHYRMVHFLVQRREIQASLKKIKI